MTISFPAAAPRGVDRRCAFSFQRADQSYSLFNSSPAPRPLLYYPDRKYIGYMQFYNLQALFALLSWYLPSIAFHFAGIPPTRASSIEPSAFCLSSFAYTLRSFGFFGGFFFPFFLPTPTQPPLVGPQCVHSVTRQTCVESTLYLTHGIILYLSAYLHKVLMDPCRV